MARTDTSYSDLLGRLRIPQPSLQRHAVIALFERLRSAPSHAGLESDPGRAALSQCLRYPSPAVADQSVRELCRLALEGLLPIADALVELLSALEGCNPSFASLFVKGIGFVSQFAFKRDSSWVANSITSPDRHPFVKVLLCRPEAHDELLHQVVLFVFRCKPVGSEEVIRFLRPFILFSVIYCPSLPSLGSFSRDLFALIASLSCLFQSEITIIIKLLTECLQYFPCKNQEEFNYLVSTAKYLVDLIVVTLKRMTHTDMLEMGIQACCVKLLNDLLSLCCHPQKSGGGIEIVFELSKLLLVVHKEIFWWFVPEFSLVIQSLSVILCQVEFEHEQLSILKLLIFLIDWKIENEKNTKGAEHDAGECRFYVCEELLYVFPIINMLSSPSKSVKGAASYLLSVVESHAPDLPMTLKSTLWSYNKGVGSIGRPAILLFRLLNRLLSEDQSPFSYFHFIRYNKAETTGASNEPYNWISQLSRHLSTSATLKSKQPSPYHDAEMEGTSLQIISVVLVLVLHPKLCVSAVDYLSTIGVTDPKAGLPIFLAALFYIKLLCNQENGSPTLLLKLLELLVQLALNSIIAPLSVQTFLPMLENEPKSVLRAEAVRLLCKTWIIAGRGFEHLQEFLDPKAFFSYLSERDMCIATAASLRDVCKHNPDRGAELILSVSSCIESQDSTVQALGFEGLAYLCEADVVDFYSAWNVISAHTADYSSNPITAHCLCTLLGCGAMDAEAYPEISGNIIRILWDVITGPCNGVIGERAHVSSFHSLSKYQVSSVEKAIPGFKNLNFEYLTAEDNPEVLKAMEGLQAKLLDYEFINRRRMVKGKRVTVYKIEKLLDVFTQIIFSPGKETIISREMPGACLVSLNFTPKELQGRGLFKDLPKLHAGYESALFEIAQSLHVSRNILFAILAFQSWKPFMYRWFTMASSLTEKSVSSNADESSTVAGDIFKILCNTAEVCIPRVAVNVVLAIAAFCMVVPPSAHGTIFAASRFLLKCLVEYEHEHQQWSAAISLGLVSTRFHATDRSNRSEVIGSLLKISHCSKSHLVKGACGVGLGFASQVLSRAEDDYTSILDGNTARKTEADLLQKIIGALSLQICRVCPGALDSFRSLHECLSLSMFDQLRDEFSDLSQISFDIVEEDAWGVAGLILGLGNSVIAMYRYGAYGAVDKLKDILISWIISVDYSSFDEPEKILLSIGACLSLPIVVAFCQRTEISVNNLGTILDSYHMIISVLLDMQKSGMLYESSLMASCIGVGSLLSFFIRDGFVKYHDIKSILEILRDTYTKSSIPAVILSGMLGIVNAFGAGICDISKLYPHQNKYLETNREQDFKESMLFSPVCEPLSTMLIQDIFLLAKDSKDYQIRSYAAWALSFLRQKWWSDNFQVLSDLEGVKNFSSPINQAPSEESLVSKLSYWLKKVNNCEFDHASGLTTVITVLRCLSRAPRLPALDWGSVIGHCMRSKPPSTNMGNPEKGYQLLREECVRFSISHANNVNTLVLFLDELTDLPRFRTLELNLQSLLLEHYHVLLKIFSSQRSEKLFEDLLEYFSSLSSLNTCYDSDQMSVLRVSFWKGVCASLTETTRESNFVSKLEKCMHCLFSLLPLSFGNNHANLNVEWCEATRCLALAQHEWLINLLKMSDKDLHSGIAHRIKSAKQISAMSRLVAMGILSFSELGKLKAYILNTVSDEIWWTVLLEVAAALFTADVTIQRQWLLDSAEISCITKHPSTALRFIGLMSGIGCKYMPLLLVDPFSVLSDLPITLPSLFSSDSWTIIRGSFVSTLLDSTERICNWAKQVAANDTTLKQDNIDGGEEQISLFLARMMHQSCLVLKDYFSCEKQLKMAMLWVPSR